MSDDEMPPCTGFAGPNPAIDKIDKDQSIKILLATDNHIGYAEDDPARGMDSINTFREILQLAVEHDVDMVLLGGDLFHENKPSRTSLYQTISALREFTMGDRPVELQVVSDKGLGISRNVSWSSINTEDENMNIGLPVFSIHGNHDDPQGTGSEGALAALDILSASGLVNYFGRVELPGAATNDDEAVEAGLKIKPVLLKKGDTKLALYGIGNIRDERFHYEMKSHRISLFRPTDDTEDWFNIVLVHQNRVPHGVANYTADTSFGDEADLIVWGHEHDCIEQAGPVSVTGKRYYITQPGSSVATSLAAGEATPKHVSLLTVQGGGRGKPSFEMKPLRLKTVRPFVFGQISLSESMEKDKNLRLDTKAQVTQFLKIRVDKMIKEANAEWRELNPEIPEKERLLPLIRLRVDWSAPVDGKGFDIGNPQRFGQDYVATVANFKDIVQFHSKKRTATRRAVADKPEMSDEEDFDINDPKAQKVEIGKFVSKYLHAQNLNVLPVKILQRAVEAYVDSKEITAISQAVTKAIAHITKTVVSLPEAEGEEEIDVDGQIEEVGKAYDRDFDSDLDNAGKKGKGKAIVAQSDEEEELAQSDETMDSMDSSAPAKKSKKAPAKKAAVKKVVEKKVFKKAPAKKKKDTSESEEEASESESEPEPPKKKAPAKKIVAPKVAAPKAAPKKATPKVTKSQPVKASAQSALFSASEESD